MCLARAWYAHGMRLAPVPCEAVAGHWREAKRAPSLGECHVQPSQRAACRLHRSRHVEACAPGECVCRWMCVGMCTRVVWMRMCVCALHVEVHAHMHVHACCMCT